MSFLVLTTCSSNADQDGSKKPMVIEFCNITKAGVRVNQMCRVFASKAGCIRWPVQMFSNKVGMTGVSSHVVVKLEEDSDMPKRNHLLYLAEATVKGFVDQQQVNCSLSPPMPEQCQQKLAKEQRYHACMENTAVIIIGDFIMLYSPYLYFMEIFKFNTIFSDIILCYLTDCCHENKV